MCGSPNAGPAPSSGDLIAVIHPVRAAQPPTAAPPPRRTKMLRNCVLRLSNAHEAMTTSDFSYDASAAAGDRQHERIEVRIHKYGTLLYSAVPAADFGMASANPVVHTFFIHGDCSGASGKGMRTPVGRQLRFGAGEEGVVGRTVSVLDQDQTVIGEGIIGWG